MIYQALIVDDEEIVCRGLAQFIKWEEHGFEVAGIAYNADDALALLKTIHVDALFIDIRMPGKTGLEMLPIIREEYPDIKTVILSSYSDFSYAREALRYQVFDYLTKPVNLKEMEGLLDRLCDVFEGQQKQSELYANRTKALLLSAARGYQEMLPDKFDLPQMEGWLGLALALRNCQLPENELLQKKNAMKEQIMAVVPEAILLDESVFSLFAMIPCRTEKNGDTFLSMLDTLCEAWQEWACGVSSFQADLDTLHEAWQEAQQALCYHRAEKRGGMILYRNIKPLFAGEVPQIQEILTETVNRLADPSKRDQVLLYVQQGISQLLKEGADFTNHQIICIRYLIELNGYLHKFNLPEEELHTHLNETLSSLLLCQREHEVSEHVLCYLEWLLTLLSRSDDQQLGKGIIREIQLYIRQNYNQDISLNSLSEQFYLHSNYLSRLFKEKTGKNFIDYLIEVRMEKAKELLQSTDHKIIEICAMTGYDNPRYFSKLFKLYTGMTPREYREQK